TYTLNFFAGTNCDEAGTNSGLSLYGSTVVTTDTNGEASFSATLEAPPSPNQFITATATDPNLVTTPFAPCITNAAVTLSVHLAANQLIISWPSAAPGFELQTAGPYGASLNWSQVTNSRVSGADRISVTLPPAERAALFRLIR